MSNPVMLPRRVANVLKAAGFTGPDATDRLCACSATDLLRLRRFGRTSLREVEKALAEMGRSLSKTSAARQRKAPPAPVGHLSAAFAAGRRVTPKVDGACGPVHLSRGSAHGPIVRIHQDRGDHVACVRLSLEQVNQVIAALEVWRAGKG